MSKHQMQVTILEEVDNTEFVHARLQNHRFPIHFHDTFVIELVTTGVDWCCGSELVAGKEQLFVHFPYAPHTGGTVKNKGLEYRAIYPSIGLFCELTGVRKSDLPLGLSFVSSESRLRRMATELFKKCESGVSTTAHSLMHDVKYMFEAVVEDANINICSGQALSPNSNDSLISKMLLVREYLSENFRRDVSTDELSEVCDLSQYYLIRSFKLHFGITPRQFLLSQRVAISKRLLAGGLSIAAVAYETGFADQSHLTRNFKRITGYNPGKFKR